MADQAPKLFAVRVGLLTSLIVFIYHLMGLQTVSIIFAVVLLTMDSVLNICVGCLIYHYLVVPFYKRKLKILSAT